MGGVQEPGGGLCGMVWHSDYRVGGRFLKQQAHS